MTHQRLRIASIIVVLWCGLASLTAVAQPGDRFALPIDEASRDTDFVAFRTGLMAAVVRRDIDVVVDSAFDDIQLGFGGESGHADFRDFMTVSEANFAPEYRNQAAAIRNAHWSALEQVLRLGGRFTDRDHFEAPYTWTYDMAPGDDPFEIYFVIGDAVPLYNQPSVKAAVIASLRYNVLTALDDDGTSPFLKVQVRMGVVGFIERPRVRSVLDYRAIFEKRNGAWKLATFLAGD